MLFKRHASNCKLFGWLKSFMQSVTKRRSNLYFSCHFWRLRCSHTRGWVEDEAWAGRLFRSDKLGLYMTDPRCHQNRGLRTKEKVRGWGNVCKNVNAHGSLKVAKMVIENKYYSSYFSLCELS